jgi:cytochrome c peroxidase
VVESSRYRNVGSGCAPVKQRVRCSRRGQLVASPRFRLLRQATAPERPSTGPCPMRRLSPLLAFLPLVIGAPACRNRSSPPSRAEVLPSRFDLVYAARLDSLDLALAALSGLPSRPDSAFAQLTFRRARAAYKRLEYLLEFEDHARAATLNSPVVAVLDEDDHTHVIPPHGLQVIEASVFPRPAKNFAKVTRGEVEVMRRMIEFIRRDSSSRTARTWQVPFAAARMELARIVTLGLAGFDATASKDGILESAEALRGVKDGLGGYQTAMQRRDSTGWQELQRSLDAGIAALSTAPGFDRFDRLDFVVRFAKPIAAALARLQQSLGLPEPDELDPWASGETDIYAAGAIDPRWFAPDYAPPPTPELVTLGRQLFFDPRLSAARRRSCATCHQPAFGFTDRRKVASVDPGHGLVRNTPTLLNAGLQRGQFADQRVAFLEFQFEEVMANPREMALRPDSAARRLGADTGLVTRFAATFGKPRETALTRQTLSIAVAAYVRSLQALNSRFDRAIRGDTAAITTSERQGFNLFMGKAACGTCHFAPLFGGTLPPAYVESEPEVIGVPATPAAKVAVVDRDLGVFAIDRAPLHRHAFKTPSVRNVALTAPYMHNGVYRTLEEVIDFYDAGGGNGLGMRLPNQTLSAEPLHLTDEEKRDLVAFLKALTDTTSVSSPSPGGSEPEPQVRPGEPGASGKS